MILLTMQPVMMKIEKIFDMCNKCVTDSCDIIIEVDDLVHDATSNDENKEDF